MKTLVAYFSAEQGITEKLAKRLAAVIDADLFEIEPEKKYTAADLSYMNPLARCNKEKFGKKDVPVKALPENLSQYERVLIGFPIWYGCAPNVVSTFCKALDFSGIKVAAFATSGGSKIGKTAEKLAPFVKGASVSDAKLFTNESDSELKNWALSI